MYVYIGKDLVYIRLGGLGRYRLQIKGAIVVAFYATEDMNISIISNSSQSVYFIFIPFL